MRMESSAHPQPGLGVGLIPHKTNRACDVQFGTLSAGLSTFRMSIGAHTAPASSAPHNGILLRPISCRRLEAMCKESELFESVSHAVGRSHSPKRL
jgi:hypothetical protein